MKHIQQHVAPIGTMNRDTRPKQASLLLGSTGCSGQYLQKRKPVSQPAGNSQHWRCTYDIQTEPAKAMAPAPPPLFLGNEDWRLLLPVQDDQSLCGTLDGPWTFAMDIP